MGIRHNQWTKERNNENYCPQNLILCFGIGMIEFFSVWTPLPYYNTKYKPIEIGHFFNNGMAQHLKLVSTVVQYNCTCCTILTNLYFLYTAIVVDSTSHVECTVANLSTVLNNCCCIIFHLFFIQSTALDWLTQVSQSTSRSSKIL